MAIEAESFESGIEWLEEPYYITPEKLRSIGRSTPEVANDLEYLLWLYGDREDLPDIHSTYLKVSPLNTILWNDEGPVAASATNHETAAEVADYIDQRRNDKLLESYNDLQSYLNFPDLMQVATILENHTLPLKVEEVDRFMLLSQQTALRQATINKYGLSGFGDISSVTTPNAWREYSRGARQLEEEPPIRISKPQRGLEEDNYLKAKARAIAHIANVFVPMYMEHGAFQRDGKRVNEFEETGSLELSYEFGGCTALVENMGDATDPEMLEPYYDLFLYIRTEKGSSCTGTLSQFVRFLSKKEKELSQGESMYLGLLQAIDYSDNVEEFKQCFAAYYHDLRTGIWIPPTTDFDFFATSNLHDLAAENAALAGADIIIDSRALNMRGPRTNAGSSTAEDFANNRFSEQAGNTYDQRVDWSRGEIEADRVSWQHTNRMIQFDPETSIVSSDVVRGEHYGLRINMTLPHELSAEGTTTIPRPYIYGYDLVSHYASDKPGNMTFEFVKATGHDPYQDVAVWIDKKRLKYFGEMLTSIGLPGCAKDLVKSKPKMLSGVFEVLERHSLYGHLGRRIQKQVTTFGDLAEFVDGDVLTGVCTVSAALAKFAIGVFVPDSQPRVIHGHRLRYASVGFMEHAQVEFSLGDKQYITEIHPSKYGQQDTYQEPYELVSRSSQPIAVFELAVRNGLDSIVLLLNQKYAGAGNISKDVFYKRLASEHKLHFGRRLFVFFQGATGLTTIDDLEADKLKQEAETIYKQLDQWQNFADTRRRPKEFGDWSDEEVTILQNALALILRPLENQ